METRVVADVAPSSMVMPKPTFKVLYVGRFALDSELVRKASSWKSRLEEAYVVELGMDIADPPFQTEEIDCRGYWLDPKAKTEEGATKKLKS